MALARHLGLNQQASADVARLFTSSSATSGAITGTAWLWFILGGVAAATAIQQLYERAFDVDSRGMRDMPRRLIWLAVLVGFSALVGWVGPSLHDAGGPVLLGVIGLTVSTAFWWFTQWFLLGGRISWRELFPSAIATAVCWVGMAVVFSIIFSGTIIADDKKYGTIGVVFALMSWFIAIGVVIILGAIAGVVWRERGTVVQGGPGQTAPQTQDLQRSQTVIPASRVPRFRLSSQLTQIESPSVTRQSRLPTHKRHHPGRAISSPLIVGLRHGCWRSAGPPGLKASRTL